MYTLIFVCILSAVAVGQPDQQLKANADILFLRFDHSPKDGVIRVDEFDALLTRDDVNNDNCVTIQEYKNANQNLTDSAANKLFGDADVDHDKCLTTADMLATFNDIDTNDDNQVNEHEWEVFFIKLFTSVFSPVGK